MAKNDNIQDLLHDVAEAIRAKKGTTDLINPQEFSKEIRSIESGGERPSVKMKDVNFYDYDGTRLYSYTWEEAMAMTELPPLPTQKGLICQEWNYTLEDMKAQDGACDIGATYITDDGKTRFYLTIDNERAKDVWLYLSGNIEVNWGDGTIESHNGSTLQLNHKYAGFGDYVVSVEVVNGKLQFQGSVYFNVMGEYLASAERMDALRKIEIGNGVSSLSDRCFQGTNLLRYIVIPNNVTTISNHACRWCKSLECLIIPNSVNKVIFENFSRCTSLRTVIIPASVKTLGGANFKNCTSLKNIHIPRSLTSFGNSEFSDCGSLRNIFLNKTSIGNSTFSICNALQKVVFNDGNISFGSYCFTSTLSLSLVDFSRCATIPTLSAANIFADSNPNAKIVVPDNLYDEWIVATNWSTYADRIVKASEYQPNNE